MVLPIIEYCDITYDNCTVRELIAIEQVQRRAALVCTGAYRHTSSDRLLAELGWQSLRTRRLTHTLIQLCKMTHQISPPYTQSTLPAAVENRYNTRNSTNNSLPVIYAKLQAPEIHSYLYLLKPGMICLLVFVVQHHFIFFKVAL